MSSAHLSNRFLVRLTFAFYLSTLVSGSCQEPFQVKFKLGENSRIVVPVTINGAGPFNFLLDTGSSDTVIERKLAEELRLPPAGNVILTTAQGEAVTPLARADSLSLAGATVRGLDVTVVNQYPNLLPKVRGSLGESFLRYFDLLIDNRRHLVQFELGPGALTEMLTGEHLPLSLHGFHENQLTRNRLVVVGHFHRNKDMKLQLDSGTPKAIMFSRLNRFDLVSEEQRTHSVGGLLGGSFDADTQTVSLQLGGRTFENLPVIVPTDKMPAMDIDGLLPTSLFRSIFISHTGRFAILDPSVKPALEQSKPAPRSDIEISDVRSSRTESPASQY